MNIKGFKRSKKSVNNNLLIVNQALAGEVGIATFVSRIFRHGSDVETKTIIDIIIQ